MDNKTKAFTMAAAAGKLDFSSAVQGLLAGHSALIEEMASNLAKKDAALLASLALSAKGARIGASSGLAKVVCEGITHGAGAAPVERDFLAQHDTA